MRLRSFLMTDSRVMIIGAATRWFSDVTGLDKPFFEFFRPFELHALNPHEMRDCLAGVAEVRGDQRVLDTLKNRPGSIEVLHILTGGNPRLIRTFYRLLNEGMNGELRQQLKRLIDGYTPYHKAIIDALPGQQSSQRPYQSRPHQRSRQHGPQQKESPPPHRPLLQHPLPHASRPHGQVAYEMVRDNAEGFI